MGTDSKIIIVLCVTLSLLGCKGRSVGVPDPDGGPVPTDGWVPPDGTVGCWPPPEQVKIRTPGEPCFVHSLDRTSTGQYVLGSSQGWSDLSARVSILDGDTLGELGHINAGSGMAHASFDQWADGVIALVEDNNEVRFQRYQIVAGRNLELLDERFLCDDCVVAWGGLETVEPYLGAVVRDLTDDHLRVFVTPRDAPEDLYISDPIAGSTPQLVADGDDLSLLYVQDEQLWSLTVDRYAGLEPATLLPGPPVAGLIGAQSYSGSIIVTAALTSDPEDPQLALNKWIGSHPDLAVSLPSPLGYPVWGSVSFSPSTVGVAWGVNLGDVGAHFVGMRTGPFEHIYGPARISAPINTTVATYSVWATTAHHPTGHAVVWGGWHEDGNYGIFGKIVPCLGGF